MVSGALKEVTISDTSSTTVFYRDYSVLLFNGKQPISALGDHSLALDLRTGGLYECNPSFGKVTVTACERVCQLEK